MPEEFKILDKNLTEDGFALTQVDRDGNIAIYEKSKPGYHAGFEVVAIQTHGAFEMHGSKIPAGESYPTSKNWGLTGFSCKTLERAREKFCELVENKNLKIEQSAEPKRRKHIALTIPENKEFTIKELAVQNSVSPALISIYIKNHPEIKLLRSESRGKGKPTNVYVLQ